MQSKPFLHAPPGRTSVRSFLFSRRLNAPFASVHPGVRFFFVLCLSSVQLHTIDTLHPDPVGATLLLLVSILVFVLSGVSRRVALLYTVVSVPAIFSLFLTWILFNPVPGSITLVRTPIYAGSVHVGFAAWQILWLLIAGGFAIWTRRLLAGLLLATLATLLLTHLVSFPEWASWTYSLYHPLTLYVSDRSLLVALTKVLGYTGMVMGTLTLVITSRDAELIGTLRQLRVPQAIIFFISTTFRALELAVADFEMIRLAQLARAVDVRPRSVIRHLRDLASIAMPMVATMIGRSSEIGDAIFARGYRINEQCADFYEEVAWRGRDWLFLALSLLCLSLALQPSFNITIFLQQHI